MGTASRYPWKRTVIAILAFGAAFGYVEAAIVDYLGVLYEPARRRVHPERPPEDVFPLLTLDEVRELTPGGGKLLGVEVAREAATLIMLAAVGLLAARNVGQWAAAFAIAFGAWDIFYYVVLKVLMNWPASLMTWDLLFLIPVPWAAPVLAPVIVSATMIAGGAWHLRCEAAGEPVQLRKRNWLGMTTGALVIIVAFTLDHANIGAGGMPQPFHWRVFGAGEAVAILSYVSALWGRPGAGNGASGQDGGVLRALPQR